MKAQERKIRDRKMEYEAVKREAQMRADALQTQSEQHKSAVADLAKREAELRRQVEDLAAVRRSFLIVDTPLTYFIFGVCR